MVKNLGFRTLVTKDVMRNGGRDTQPNPMDMGTGQDLYTQQRARALARVKVAAGGTRASVLTQMQANEPILACPRQILEQHNERVKGRHGVVPLGNPGLIARGCAGNEYGVASRLLNIPRFSKAPTTVAADLAKCGGEQVVGRTFTGMAYGQPDLWCRKTKMCGGDGSCARK